MSSQPKSVVKVDATTGTVNKDFLKDWEKIRSLQRIQEAVVREPSKT